MILRTLLPSTFLLCFCMFMSSFTANAQNQSTIVADILDANEVPLPFGNILVYSTDSTFITGVYINDGVFELNAITLDKGIVKISSHENADYFIDFDNSEKKDTIDLGKITLLPSNVLGPVVVTSYIPIFEADGSATIVNVDKTILGASDSPIEILKKTPGVTVTSGAVSVIGKGNAAIFMDGQRITVEQFNNIPVNEIIKIEIIRDPSARYDGDAAAIIRVITRNYYYEGVSVNLRQSITIPTFRSNTAIGVNYQRKKLTLKFNYGFSYGDSWSTKEESTERIGSYKTDLDARENSNAMNHNIGGGIIYKLDSTSSISALYSGGLSDASIYVNSHNTITDDIVSIYEAENFGEINAWNQNFVVNYKKMFDTLGTSLFVGGQYTLSEFDLSDSISEDITFASIFQGNAQRRIASSNDISILTGQADFEKHFKKSASWGIGAKYSNAQTSGALNMDNLVGSVWEPVTAFNSTTAFNEDIYAAYTEFEKSFKTVDLSVGVRYEHTDAKGLTTQEGQVSLDRKYHWFLPSVLIKKTLSEHVNLSLSYNNAIGRPSYSDLDPRVLYIDSLTSKQGNPLLLPQRDHAIATALNLGNLTLNFTYYRSVNAFKNVVREGLSGENSVTLYRENVDADRFYASLTLPFRSKSFTNYIYYFIGWDKVRGDFGDFTTIDLKPSHYLYIYNEIKFKDYFSLELIGSYNSGRYDGMYQDVSTYTVSVGVTKSFFKNKLRCTVLGSDLFFTERNAATYYIGDYSVSYLARSYTQNVRFSLSYNFGRLKHPRDNALGVGDDQKDRIK